jgi:3-mercaptopyruvate sulfurtransferase SseA
MRLFISLSAAVMLFGVLALTACNSSDGSGARNTASSQTTTTTNAAKQMPTPAVAKPTPGDGARRVTVAEAREAVDKGTAVIVDVRSIEQYKANHIKGSLHIPEAEVAARSGELPRDKMIITYCS